MNKNLKNVLLYIGIPIILILSIASVSLFGSKAVDSTYYDIVTSVKNGEVSEYTLNLYSGELVFKTAKDGKTHRYTMADPNIFYNDVNDFVMQYNEEHPDAPIKMDYKSGNAGAWIKQLMPSLLLLVSMVINLLGKSLLTIKLS